MANSHSNKTDIEKAGEDLFDFAIERESVKAIMDTLPEDVPLNKNKVEYELQILKIISVGWGISFCLEDVTLKQQLSEVFWKAVQEFSESLSDATSLTTGQDIDYFLTLKERLDMYVDALNQKPHATEPAVVIGPEFAKACGNEDEVFTVMAGSRMFISTMGGVKDYLRSFQVSLSS
jgi:hypothetical protein